MRDSQQGDCVLVEEWLDNFGAELLKLDFPVLEPLLSLLLAGQLQVFGCELRGVVCASGGNRAHRSIHKLLAGCSMLDSRPKPSRAPGMLDARPKPSRAPGMRNSRPKPSRAAPESSRLGESAESSGSSAGPDIDASGAQRDVRAQASFFSDVVQKWRGRILCDHDCTEDHVMFESLLQFLEGVGNMFCSMGVSLREKYSLHRYCIDRTAYSAAALRRAWLLSGVTKLDHLLKDVVLRSMELVMPADQAQTLRVAFEEKSVVAPSAGTISRHRLRIDCSFMLCFRGVSAQRTQRGVARYLLFESSPSEYDWEMVERYEKDTLNIAEGPPPVPMLVMRATSAMTRCRSLVTSWLAFLATTCVC